MYHLKRVSWPMDQEPAGIPHCVNWRYGRHPYYIFANFIGRTYRDRQFFVTRGPGLPGFSPAENPVKIRQGVPTVCHSRMSGDGCRGKEPGETGLRAGIEIFTGSGSEKRMVGCDKLQIVHLDYRVKQDYAQYQKNTHRVGKIIKNAVQQSGDCRRLFIRGNHVE